MIVVKIKGKKYVEEEREQNSKIIRKWFINRCIAKTKFEEKYYCIEDVNEVIKR